MLSNRVYCQTVLVVVDLQLLYTTYVLLFMRWHVMCLWSSESCDPVYDLIFSGFVLCVTYLS